MVPVAGLEPARDVEVSLDFLTTLYFYSPNKIGCSLEHVFTLPFSLGSWYMLSTHL